MIKDIRRGDTQTYEFHFKKGEEPLALFGRIIRMTFKSQLSLPDDEAEIRFRVEPPDNQDSTDGKITIELDSDMTSVAPGTYVYDLQIVTPYPEEPERKDHVKTVITGQVDVLDDVTKSVD